MIWLTHTHTHVLSVYKSLRHNISWIRLGIFLETCDSAKLPIRIHRYNCNNGCPRHYVVKLRFAAIITYWSSSRYLDGDAVLIMLRVGREVPSTMAREQHQTPSRVCPGGDQPCRIQTVFCFSFFSRFFAFAVSCFSFSQELRRCSPASA